MYKICVVDDEPDVCDRIGDLLKKYGETFAAEFEVQKFNSAAAYLAADDADSDIIFLDIDMPETNGMELARKIRGRRPDVIIIFCTNLQQFAINGYEVAAFGFIVKPVQWYSFVFYMDKAVQRLSKVRGGGPYLIKTAGGQRLVRIRDICYIEVRRHNLFYHICAGEEKKIEILQTRGNMQDAEKRLSPHNFIRCSISYLVNLAHVSYINGNDVYLEQAILPVSRNHKKAFTEAFMSFLAKGEAAI